MKTVTSLTTIPKSSVIANGFGKVDYCDSYRVTNATNDTAKDIAIRIFKQSKWEKWLFGIRDLIVGIFGLKTSKEIIKGQTIGFFPIIEQHENEIVFGENDKHLNIRVSVLVDRENSFIYLTTIVHFNNFFGRLYFFSVKPFHKIIVKSGFKRKVFEKA